jgi:hypothetical protein
MLNKPNILLVLLFEFVNTSIRIIFTTAATFFYRFLYKISIGTMEQLINSICIIIISIIIIINYL